MSSDAERIKALRRRANKARSFPVNTCAASRHLHIMADCLLKGGYPMLQEEPEHCAESILATVAALWEARTKLLKIGAMVGLPPEINVKVQEIEAQLGKRIDAAGETKGETK